MRFLFKNKKVRVVSIIALVLVCLIVLYSTVIKNTAFHSNIVSSVINPIQTMFSNISKSVNDKKNEQTENKKLLKKIEELEGIISEQNQKLVDYEEAIRQNEFYKDFLEIKEENPSYKFVDARIISRNTNDTYCSFIIDKGTVDGVKVHDTIITAEGLVGYVSDAYTTQSTVTTVLNPKINISAIDNHSRDTGNVTGDASLSVDGFTKMIYISSENTMSSGNFVITSGEGGIFPKGLIIGTVVEVKTSQNKISCEATIQPIIDFNKINDVMIITDF